jgi:hypothetical protein
MSPGAQSRDDTPLAADTGLRNGMSAKRWGEGEGGKGRSRRAGARSAALEVLALTPASCASRASVLGFGRVSRGRSRAAARSRLVRRGPDRRSPEGPPRSPCPEAAVAGRRATRRNQPAGRLVRRRQRANAGRGSGGQSVAAEGQCRKLASPCGAHDRPHVRFRSGEPGKGSEARALPWTRQGQSPWNQPVGVCCIGLSSFTR